MAETMRFHVDEVEGRGVPTVAVKAVPDTIAFLPGGSTVGSFDIPFEAFIVMAKFAGGLSGVSTVETGSKWFPGLSQTGHEKLLHIGAVKAMGTVVNRGTPGTSAADTMANDSIPTAWAGDRLWVQRAINNPAAKMNVARIVQSTSSSTLTIDLAV